MTTIFKAKPETALTKAELQILSARLKGISLRAIARCVDISYEQVRKIEIKAKEKIGEGGVEIPRLPEKIRVEPYVKQYATKKQKIELLRKYGMTERKIQKWKTLHYLDKISFEHLEIVLPILVEKNLINRVYGSILRSIDKIFHKNDNLEDTKRQICEYLQRRQDARMI